MDKAHEQQERGFDGFCSIILHYIPGVNPGKQSGHYRNLQKLATLLTLLTFVAVEQAVRRCKQMESGVGKGDI